MASLAAELTPVRDIAALLDMEEDALRAELAMPGSPMRRAYLKAKARTALEMRRRELELARVGSPLAVQMAGAYLRDMDLQDDV